MWLEGLTVNKMEKCSDIIMTTEKVMDTVFLDRVP